MGSCSLASSNKQEAAPPRPAPPAPLFGANKEGDIFQRDSYVRGMLCGLGSQRPSKKLTVILGRKARRTFRVVPTAPHPLPLCIVRHPHEHPTQVQWDPVLSSLKGTFPAHRAPLGSCWRPAAELGRPARTSPLVSVPPAVSRHRHLHLPGHHRLGIRSLDP